MKEQTHYTALVLAGERGGGDQLSLGQLNGVACKALIPVGGKPMLLRVLESLEASCLVDSIWLCGPNEAIVQNDPLLQNLISSQRVSWCSPMEQPSRSVSMAASQLPVDYPVLITTTDHALLNSDIVDYFCSEAGSVDSGLTVGLAKYSLVKRAYPVIKRTVLKFKEGNFCTCNLFAVQQKALKSVADFWIRVENNRKKPWKMVYYFSLSAALAYALGRLSLSQALEIASKNLQIKVSAIDLPFPESAIDVDTQADLQLVRSIVESD